MNLFKKAKKWVTDALGLSNSQQAKTMPSRNEMRLDADEWVVKQKLGKSFFTRRLNPNVRATRIASLTNAEYALAKNRGWL